MKTTEIVGFKRTELGTKYSKRLRAEGNAPCVVYGPGKENIHFHAPMYLFKELLYTPDAYFVNLNIEGEEKRAILKDATFHPVSEMILHVDFLEISDEKEIVMDIPVKLVGSSKGAQVGGQLFMKQKSLKVKALPKDMPGEVELDISELALGKTMRVKDVKQEGFNVITGQSVSVVSCIVPRALKAAGVGEEEEEGEEG